MNVFQSTFLIRDLTGKELLRAMYGEGRLVQLTILLPNICGNRRRGIAGIYWDSVVGPSLAILIRLTSPYFAFN